jgi:hydroxyquinol 1,2-dioxygenase
MDTLQADTDTASETEKAILADARARFETTENPRIRELILGLIDHLHAFVREQKVSWSEWEYFMGFLARAAAVTKDGRNEFIASDSIGISMQVLAASQPKPAGATIPTLIGPFFIDGAPVFPIGTDIAGGASGQPLYAYGRVLDTKGSRSRTRSLTYGSRMTAGSMTCRTISIQRRCGDAAASNVIPRAVTPSGA